VRYVGSDGRDCFPSKVHPTPSGFAHNLPRTIPTSRQVSRAHSDSNGMLRVVVASNVSTCIPALAVCIIPGRSCGDWHFKVTSKPFGLPVEGGVVNPPEMICTLDFLSTAKCFDHRATGHLTLQQFQMRLIITMCVVAPVVLQVCQSNPLFQTPAMKTLIFNVPSTSPQCKFHPSI